MVTAIAAVAEILTLLITPHAASVKFPVDTKRFPVVPFASQVGVPLLEINVDQRLPANFPTVIAAVAEILALLKRPHAGFTAPAMRT